MVFGFVWSGLGLGLWVWVIKAARGGRWVAASRGLPCETCRAGPVRLPTDMAQEQTCSLQAVHLDSCAAGWHLARINAWLDLDGASKCLQGFGERREANGRIETIGRHVLVK